MAEISVEVRISGLLPEDARDDVGDLSVRTTGASTVLTGEVTDQAALLGLLARLRAHGLQVTEVRRVPAPREAPTGTGETGSA